MINEKQCAACGSENIEIRNEKMIGRLVSDEEFDYVDTYQHCNTCTEDFGIPGSSEEGYLAKKVDALEQKIYGIDRPRLEWCKSCREPVLLDAGDTIEECHGCPPIVHYARLCKEGVDDILHHFEASLQLMYLPVSQKVTMSLVSEKYDIDVILNIVDTRSCNTMCETNYRGLQDDE